MTMQTILEGKRLWEDSIVGDNPFQFHLLPTLGIRRVGELRNRTGTGKGLVLFDFSLLEDGALDIMLSRIRRDTIVHLLVDWWTGEVWRLNIELYAKQLPELAGEISRIRERLMQEPFIQLHRDDSPHPTVARRG
jgi:hypothetical protein